MDELDNEKIVKIIEAMRLAYLKKYLHATNYTLELLEKLNENFRRGLCAIFVLALKEVIPQAEVCKVDGLFGNHAFLKIGDNYYDGNGKLDIESFALWEADERFFDITVAEIFPLLPFDYLERIDYYTEMITYLSQSGKDVLKNKLK